MLARFFSCLKINYIGNKHQNGFEFLHKPAQMLRQVNQTNRAWSIRQGARRVSVEDVRGRYLLLLHSHTRAPPFALVQQSLAHHAEEVDK